MMIRLILLCAVGLSTGCATDRASCSHVLRSDPYMRENPELRSEAMQEVSRESYIDAQMAYNAYQRSDSFVFPDSIIQLPPETRGYGFQATIFEVRSGSDLREVV